MNRVIALDVCENGLFGLNGEICKCFDVKYVRSSLRQLHLIFHKFSTELFPLIYVKSVFQSKWLEFYKCFVYALM